MIKNKHFCHMLIAGIQNKIGKEALSVWKSDWITIWISRTTWTKISGSVPITKTLYSIAQCLCVITNNKMRWTQEEEEDEKQKHDLKTRKKKVIQKNYWNLKKEKTFKSVCFEKQILKEWIRKVFCWGRKKHILFFSKEINPHKSTQKQREFNQFL